MIKKSRYDENIVYISSEDARMQHRQIAKTLRKSPQHLKYAHDSYVRDGLLKHPYAIIDYSYFGLILFRVYFRNAYVAETDKAKMIEKFRENPYIVSLYELIGEFDIAAEFACPNASRFNKELKAFMRDNPTLHDCSIALNVVSYLCPKRYLTKRASLQTLFRNIIIGGDREPAQFTLQERGVLRSLLMHPKLPLTKLSAAAGLSVKTARKVMKDLERREIFLGVKYVTDPALMGISKARVFLWLHNLNQDRENQLTQFILKQQGTVKLSKTIGDWSIEVDVEARDKKEIRRFMLEIKESFKELVARSNLMDYHDCFFRRYLPLFLLQENAKGDKK